MKNTAIYILAFTFTLGTVLTGCEAAKNSNKTQRGAVIGTVAGGVLGAVIGNNVGKGGNGALGAVIGGVVGGEIKTALPGAQVERVGEGIRLVLGENAIRFDTNKSNLTATAQANLDKLIPVLKEYADTDIAIYGFTDSTGSDEYNQTLSEQRAASVKNYLASRGLSTTRLKVIGLGETDPVSSNDTVEGRSENRRVEFTIVANEKMIEDAKKEAGN
jgi:outer membrane protein OmpA-like peptidoglycan-associated protein